MFTLRGGRISLVSQQHYLINYLCNEASMTRDLK
jgi:hypothetical protein